MLAASSSSIDIARYVDRPPFVYAQPHAAARPSLPYFGAVGTGGQASEVYVRGRPGYDFVFVVLPAETTAPVGSASLSHDMVDVRRAFDRTFSRLTEVFGVSRQTLYNWLKGDTPRDQQQIRIRELAAAARHFSSLQFCPTLGQLDRPIRGGKSFLQLVAEGAGGVTSAADLVRAVERGRRDRSRLDSLLGDQAAVPNTRADFELPSFAEDFNRR